nr:hypothetical protein Itr_chr14CG11380 [Ipomoea trifida]
MTFEENVHQPDRTQQPTATVKGSHRKRTRNLDIVPFEGREGPSDIAVEGKQPKSKKQCASHHGLPIVKSRASSPQYVEAIQILTQLNEKLLKR